VAGLDQSPVYDFIYEDLGGYYTRGLKGAVRPVSAGKYLFVLESSNGIWGIEPSGTATRLVEPKQGNQFPTILGNDASASRLLVLDSTHVNVLDVETGQMRDLGSADAAAWYMQGWVAGPDRAYVLSVSYNGRTLKLYKVGSAPQVVGRPYELSGPSSNRDPWSFVAAPTHDYAGAWMIQRDPGKPTTLLRHTAAEGVKTFWSDITGPLVEALHPGVSGERVLIQVHRPRQQPERWFVDPALAIWKIGDPAPRDYDELFVNESEQKGFVHLDVDAMAQGHSFVFDSGIGNVPDSRVSRRSPARRRRTGVGRRALRAQTGLVLPGIARLPGAFNSYWKSDVVIYNPTNAEQSVVIRYAPLSESKAGDETIDLRAREIRVINDALKELFGIETGGGSLHIEPSVSVNATGRTYTTASTGTYGFSMTAVDAYTAAGARFRCRLRARSPARCSARTFSSLRRGDSSPARACRRMACRARWAHRASRSRP
jgi:hypothetical protein